MIVDVETVAATATGAGVVAGAVAAALRGFVRGFKKWIREEVIEPVNTVRAEVTTNGGSSTKDAVHRIESKIDQLNTRYEEHLRMGHGGAR